MAPKTSAKKRKSTDNVVNDSKSTKKVRTTSTAASPSNGTSTLKAATSAKSKPASTPTQPKPSRKAKPTVAPEVEAAQDDFTKFGGASSDDSADEEIEDDQAAALLAGFESSDDDDDDLGDMADGDEGGVIVPAKPLPAFPESEDLRKQLSAAAAAKSSGGSSNNNNDDVPGTIYVGRLPHGFYEHQMKAYFSQFGEIRRLRMAHNRRTGASKHYAFVEFASAEVAKVVADTMDSYLMYGHILKVKYLAPEKIHAELWQGAGKRFRKIPWNRIEKNKLEKVARQGWEKRVSKEEKRRQGKQEKLKALGYTYEAPKLRNVDEVAVKKPTTPQTETVESATAKEKMIETAPDKAMDGVEALLNGKGKTGKEPYRVEVATKKEKTKKSAKGGEAAVDAVAVAALDAADAATAVAGASSIPSDKLTTSEEKKKKKRRAVKA